MAPTDKQHLKEGNTAFGVLDFRQPLTPEDYGSLWEQVTFPQVRSYSRVFLGSPGPMLTCRDLLEGFRTGMSPWPWTNVTCLEPPPLKKPQFSFFNFISSLRNTTDIFISSDFVLVLFFLLASTFTVEVFTYVLLNLSGSFLWVFSSNLWASKLMNSVLKVHSSRLSYSCSCSIKKSSCIVLKVRTKQGKL